MRPIAEGDWHAFEKNTAGPQRLCTSRASCALAPGLPVGGPAESCRMASRLTMGSRGGIRKLGMSRAVRARARARAARLVIEVARDGSDVNGNDSCP